MQSRLLLICGLIIASLCSSKLMAQTESKQAATRSSENSSEPLRIGVAEKDITPPEGFPIAGYYHERLADGTIDPLKAKAMVFQQGDTACALVVCDLIGIATDLSREIKRRAELRTGIPASGIVIAATHSHTAPEYMDDLWLYLGKQRQEQLRFDYIEKLINGPVEAIVSAQSSACEVDLTCGSIQQQSPVSFNRRFVMRDGSVKTWQSLSNPEVVRPAGPIDSDVQVLVVESQADKRTIGILSNFALHLDTVGGTRWSADYPYFIEQTVREKVGPDVISIFGTGCCGDINHYDPSTSERNTADKIGRSLGETICQGLEKLKPIANRQLQVKSQVVKLPLQSVSRAEVERATDLLSVVKSGGKVEFLDHVAAYKQVMIDHLLHEQPYVETAKHIKSGLSRSLAGIGELLPVEVTAITIGDEVGIVCLPGEVFVELGLAIKQASPYRTTLVIELANAFETIYIPNRAAYASGGYEVTNSTLQPGSGEILVEFAIGLLRQTASNRR